jgi:phage terminase large subunit GpA-like protein
MKKDSQTGNTSKGTSPRQHDYRPSPVAIPVDKSQGVFNQLQQRLRNPTQANKKATLLDWTMRNRRFDGRLPEMPFPMRDLYDDDHQEIVMMKAAQIGISEYGINIVLWGADIAWGERGVCLYVFPKQEQMDDFSQDRVNRAIRGSEYLKNRMGITDRSDNANRVRLRKLGGRPIYFRGSDSTAQTRSIDADILVCDEVDLFKEGAVARENDSDLHSLLCFGHSLSPSIRMGL